jgi:phosphoglycolate phosphatase
MLGTIGFDLDLTLVDSLPGIARSMRALGAETGVAIDVELVLSRIGAKLEHELAHWYPADEVAGAARRYREIYFDACVDGGTVPLPGAPEVVETVHELGGRVLVVTAKSEALAKRCLEYVGLPYDALTGLAFGTEKSDALREHDARFYVGDTVTDVASALGASATPIAVTTGPDDAAALTRAGAAYVFPSLHEVAAFLRESSERAL